MGDEWWDGLTLEELKGIHVKALMNSERGDDEKFTVEGVLDNCGRIAGSEHCLFVTSNRWGEKFDKTVTPTANVFRVNKVWDEREFLRLDLKDLVDSKAHVDQVVVNGAMYDVYDIDYDELTVSLGISGAQSVSFEMVSDFLLQRPFVLLKNDSYYRDALGRYWHSIAGCLMSLGSDGEYISDSDEKLIRMMPLTEVHFVDGPEEKNDEEGYLAS